jgi:hypothetical protein
LGSDHAGHAPGGKPRKCQTLPKWKKREKADESEESAGAAAEPQNLCAQIDAEVDAIYPAHPAAVLLVMAWTRLKQASMDERAAYLLALEGVAPADQVRQWHGVYLREGLDPWHVLYLPAPTWGDDCTKCKHLMTRHEAIGGDRRRYHWACQHGYLILEHGRGTERVYIAPPECQSFERWYPSEQR